MIISIATLLVLYAIWIAGIVWQYVRSKQMAAEEFEALSSRNELPSNATADAYERTFLKFYGPRASIYMLAASGAVIILLPFVVNGLNLIWRMIWRLSGRDDVFREGELIHSFLLAIGCLAVFVAMAAVFMRRYHQKAPKNFDAELERQIIGANG